MKAFDVRRDGIELRMLTAEQFLIRTNDYRVTDCLPVVKSSLELTKPLVKFSSPADQLSGVVKEYRETFSRLPLDQQADCAFVPFVTSSRKSRQTPSAPVGKRKQLAVYFQLRLCQPHRPRPCPRVQEGATALTKRNEEEEDGGSCGPREDDGDDEYMDIGDENMQDQNMLSDDDVGVTSEHGPGDIPTDSVGAAVGRPLSSPTIWHSQGGSPGVKVGMTRRSREDQSRGKGQEKLFLLLPLTRDKRGLTLLTRLVELWWHPRRRDLLGRAARGEDLAVVAAAVVTQEKASTIKSSITMEPGAWDRPELVLAPVDRNDIVGGHGRRITPTEFFEKDSSEFDWYAVCGQHTVEVMKTLVKKSSPAVDVYGLRTYSKVRVVYFGDDQTRGYFNVSAFDNTRENRAMMLSFEDAVRDMRQWWIDNHRIEAPEGKMNLATSTEVVWPLVEKFFEMFNEGKLPVGDGKIPLDMPGRMEGRQPGPYTDETKGQRTLYHCIYARDDPKGFTVSWKDLCPSFKNFGDLTCREREVALLLLMKGKVVVTNVKVMPPRVNTECLLDIMRKERYMVRMFNYVVFRAEGRADDEWNDAFFMSYKDLEDRYGPNGLCAAEWEKGRDKLQVSKVKTVPRRLGGVEEARQGSGLGPTAAMYKEAPFHFKAFVYTSIDKLDLLRAEVKRVASSARHIVWDKLKKQTTLLPVCMPLKEVVAASDDIVVAAQKMTYRAVILDISPANFYTTWTSQEFDALHSMMTKCCGVNWVLFVLAPQKVQSDVLRCLFRWEDIKLILGTWKWVDRPSNDITRYDNIATASRDMMAIVLHAEGRYLRKVTVAPHLVNDLTNVHVVEEKFEKCLGKHGGIEGDESVVYSIWEREPGKLRSLCGSFVGEAEGVLLLGRVHAGLVWEFLLAGNNVIACEESTKDIAYLTKFIDILVKDDRFNCHVKKPRCKYRPNRDMFHKLRPKRLKVWEYLFRDMPQGQLDGKYIYRKAKATKTLKHYHGALTGAFETFVARCEILKFDLRKDQLTSKDYAELAKSGDGFNPVDNEEDSSDSDLELGEDTCAEVLRGGMVQAHDDGTVHSHEGSIPVAAPSVASMVVPSETAALQDIGRCRQSETAIKVKAEELFHVLRDNRQLEYSNKFYALRSSPSRGSINWKVDQTARTLEGSCYHDFMPSTEPASVAAQAGHRGDDWTTVVGPQEVNMTSMPQISEKSISVAAAQSSPPIDVSTTLPPDAGARYGSLLITNAAMQGRSEIESESDVGPSVAESQLQPSLCTGKGDAQSPLTPQGGAGGDGGKGGDVKGILHSRNLDTLTADID
ncbi:hypothetical protein CBR_g30480 [Chara braunii]|uniref:Uncharacterized protein n=1 Tax=Chara braunii TaxID=69332 RepID=A0A388LD27_CHABU|nr:hypothetical protein CBR_g30480 [Chara braunii]|eukprot:GBG80113.1 hypothetical protein CBR_g30480 [Chara braunii]